MADSSPAPTLSAVITCYQDEPAIRPMHTRLTAVFTTLGVSYEIIFVNDGSPDDADAVLEELTAQDDHVLAIEHSRNFGSQSAFVSGMQFATGDAIILLDGDLQDPPELVFDFYAKWQEGYDVVYGRRGKREGSLVFALLVKGFYRITPQLMDDAQDRMIVVHPLPRLTEISPDVDRDERAAYFRQVQNGMFVRMALLAAVLGAA